jgi:YHS domain-containing protein
MSALIWFVVWAALIFLMMRFGCGAHVMGRRHGGTKRGEPGDVRWAPPDTDTDPVCGKTVSTASAKSNVFGGLVYYFCSRECREVFEAAPHLYTGRNDAAGRGKLESLHG